MAHSVGGILLNIQKKPPMQQQMAPGGIFFFLNGLPLIKNSATAITKTENVIATEEQKSLNITSHKSLNSSSTNTLTPSSKSSSIDCELILDNIPLKIRTPTPISNHLKIKITKEPRNLTVSKSPRKSPRKTPKSKRKSKRKSKSSDCNKQKTDNNKFLHVIKENNRLNDANMVLDEISFEFNAEITPLVTPYNKSPSHLDKPKGFDIPNQVGRDSVLDAEEGWWVADDYYSYDVY